MKKAAFTLVLFYLLITIGGLLLGIPLFNAVFAGGAREGFLYPIYWAINLLAGLIVLCTETILKEIRELKSKVLNITTEKEQN